MFLNLRGMAERSKFFFFNSIPWGSVETCSVKWFSRGLLGIVVQPLDLHLVNVGSIPTGPTHFEVRPQPHPGEMRGSFRTFGVDVSTSPEGAAVDAHHRAWDLWESNPR